jgi:SAM-dependent methyltransferase
MTEQASQAPDTATQPEDPKMAAYRASQKERERIDEIFRLVPQGGKTALDIGARDGFLSLRLAERFDRVTALDLVLPRIDHPSVDCVVGDVCALEAPDRAFDLVLCAEVLEHIPSHLLRKACAELSRVCGKHLVIGVPYDQDTRVYRTTCSACGGKNPPWGHVNTFNELSLELLFPELVVEKVFFVGETRERTNALSAFLTDLAGNPWGTYGQQESCIHCGTGLKAPTRMGPVQRVAASAGERLRKLQMKLSSPRPNWIHILYTKPHA